MIGKIGRKIMALRKLENRMMLYLMIAMFLNPLGFDILFAMTLSLTGSLMITDIIFYCLSAFFFGLFLYSRHNYHKRLNGKEK
jgi:hypothetical protein